MTAFSKCSLTSSKKKLQPKTALSSGSCANYVLENHDNCIRVFIYADMEKRINRIMSRHGLVDRDVAIKLIKKTDKHRRSYYQFYSEMKWGPSRRSGFAD